MVNILHIPAEDGSIIEVNAQELQTPEGIEWLQEELEARRLNITKKIKDVTAKTEEL